VRGRADPDDMQVSMVDVILILIERLPPRGSKRGGSGGVRRLDVAVDGRGEVPARVEAAGVAPIVVGDVILVR
jgi:hypothetical protein